MLIISNQAHTILITMKNIFTLFVITIIVPLYVNAHEDREQSAFNLPAHQNLAEQVLAEHAEEITDSEETVADEETAEQGAEIEEQECLTICDEWRRECNINPRTGARKCRRMCKSLVEECF